MVLLDPVSSSYCSIYHSYVVFTCCTVGIPSGAMCYLVLSAMSTVSGCTRCYEDLMYHCRTANYE